MTTDPKKDRDRRRAEFQSLYDSIPGTDEDKTKRICDILHYQPHTIAVLRSRRKLADGTETTWRVMPEAKLRILKDALASTSV